MTVLTILTNTIINHPLKQLMTMNTEEGNKLIAEFMGLKNLHADNWFTDGADIGFYIDDGICYHTSWDWLMPVVEKIENLGYRVWMERGGGIIYYSKIKKGGIVVADCDTFSNQSGLQAAWLCIIQFITWYTTQQPSNK